MRNYLIILTLLLGFSFNTYKDYMKDTSFKTIQYENPIPAPKEGSTEELYKDIMMTTLEPYISKAIEDYYGYAFLYSLWNVDILEMYRPEGYRSFSFILKIQIKPFVGAHNTIGIDEVTLSINPRNIEIVKFEHIKSFELPEHFKEYYKDLKGL